MADELPLATELYEESAHRIFSEYKQMSPEEYAGRYGHTIYCSSFDTFRYRDTDLQAWIYELHAILRDPNRARACQSRYYTEDQLKELESEGL